MDEQQRTKLLRRQPGATPKFGRTRIITTFRFAATVLIASLALGLIQALFELPVQILALGVYVSILGGLLVSYLDIAAKREEDQRIATDQLLDALGVVKKLASRPQLYEQYLKMVDTLRQIAEHDDSVFREAAAIQVATLVAKLQDVRPGVLEFTGEQWRTVYKAILLRPGLDYYKSVAHAKNDDYWQDAPGRVSTEINVRLVKLGARVERIVILREKDKHLWNGTCIPNESRVGEWMRQQQENGIRVYCVLESQLSRDASLIRDFGIYGSRAVGYQFTDDNCRIERFLLHFDTNKLDVANSHWEQLKLYARPLVDISEKSPEPPSRTLRVAPSVESADDSAEA